MMKPASNHISDPRRPLVNQRVVVTGTGVCSSIALNTEEFADALRQSRSGFGLRTEREQKIIRVGAYLDEDQVNDALRHLAWPSQEVAGSANRLLRRTPLACRAGTLVAFEAVLQARLDTRAHGESIGLIIAGSNFHQQEVLENARHFFRKPEYVNPRYAVNLADAGLVGVISEILNIRGPGITVGGGAASGGLALHQAYQWVQSGMVTACVCVGGLSEFSALERQGFVNLGAMAEHSAKFEPHQVCRPFDRGAKGFVYGEGSGCLVLENFDHAQSRSVDALGEIRSASIGLSGSYSAEPSREAEVRVMQQSLQHAQLSPDAIGYLNSHGSSTPLGDAVECQAIRDVFGTEDGPMINSTKALTGHTYCATGVVETVATLLQMRGGFLHGNPNLDDPIDKQLRFVGKHSVDAIIDVAMSNSFGFGGINASLIMEVIRSL